MVAWCGMAEAVRFELTRGYSPLPIFETGALSQARPRFRKLCEGHGARTRLPSSRLTAGGKRVEPRPHPDAAQGPSHELGGGARGALAKIIPGPDSLWLASTRSGQHMSLASSVVCSGNDRPGYGTLAADVAEEVGFEPTEPLRGSPR